MKIVAEMFYHVETFDYIYIIIKNMTNIQHIINHNQNHLEQLSDKEISILYNARQLHHYINLQKLLITFEK